jgi:c-di-GMP-binding flagellar brake protein YcgR
MTMADEGQVQQARMASEDADASDDAERRRALRRKLPFGRGAILEIGDKTHIVGLADVSATGAYVTTRAPLRVGETHVVRLLMVPERIEMAFRVEVVRVAQSDHESTAHPRGAAVRFLEVDADARERLQDFVARGPMSRLS